MPFGLPTETKLTREWDYLQPRERMVVNAFIKRLYVGQDTYGPLAKGKKNWLRETFEEELDATVYLINAMLDKAGIP